MLPMGDFCSWHHQETCFCKFGTTAGRGLLLWQLRSARQCSLLDLFLTVVTAPHRRLPPGVKASRAVPGWIGVLVEEGEVWSPGYTGAGARLDDVAGAVAVGSYFAAEQLVE